MIDLPKCKNCNAELIESRRQSVFCSSICSKRFSNRLTNAKKLEEGREKKKVYITQFIGLLEEAIEKIHGHGVKDESKFIPRARDAIHAYRFGEVER